MYRTIKLFAAAMAAALTLSALACGTAAPAASTTSSDTTAAAADTTAADYSSMTFIERIQAANSAISDGLPDRDCAGQTFIVYGESTPEELNGEVVNDAEYSQAHTVSERFDLALNIKLFSNENWDDYLKEMDTLFLAADTSSMNLVKTRNTSSAAMVKAGYFTELSGLKYVDTTKPWYFKSEMDSYGYKGKYWLATGFMAPADVMNNVGCVYFNKDMMTSYSVADVYQTVTDGGWTLDYVYGLTKDFYEDANGDGTRGDDDVYGVAVSTCVTSIYMLQSEELPQIYFADDGTPHYSMFDRADEAEKLWDGFKALFTSDGAITADWDINSFVAGKSLFGIMSLSGLGSLRSSDVNYGIVPPFKYSEAQADYCTSYLPNPYAIPYFEQDPELSSIVLTALAAEGYKQVLPAEYETAIKSKYATDEQSGEMIDMMMKNVRAEPMFIYGSDSYIYNLRNYCAPTNKAEFASYWAKQQSSLQKQLDGVVEAMGKM